MFKDLRDLTLNQTTNKELVNKMSSIKSSKYGNMTLGLTDKGELKIEFSNGNAWLLSLYHTNSIRDFLNWYKKR